MEKGRIGSGLVLSRKVGETVCVGNDVVVSVVSIRGNKVRLLFEAPPDMRVDRLEVRELINGHKDLESHAVRRAVE